jgi:ankyrin repeat protein
MRVARVLLDRGADVDRMGYPWQSPLLKAIKQNFTEMVVLLMERGANPSVVGGFQRSETALSYATRLNRGQVLGVFRSYGYEGGPVQYC